MVTHPLLPRAFSFLCNMSTQPTRHGRFLGAITGQFGGSSLVGFPGFLCTHLCSCPFMPVLCCALEWVRRCVTLIARSCECGGMEQGVGEFAAFSCDGNQRPGAWRCTRSRGKPRDFKEGSRASKPFCCGIGNSSCYIVTKTESIGHTIRCTCQVHFTSASQHFYPHATDERNRVSQGLLASGRARK